MLSQLCAFKFTFRVKTWHVVLTYANFVSNSISSLMSFISLSKSSLSGLVIWSKSISWLSGHSLIIVAQSISFMVVAKSVAIYVLCICWNAFDHSTNFVTVHLCMFIYIYMQDLCCVYNCACRTPTHVELRVTCRHDRNNKWLKTVDGCKRNSCTL